MISLMRVHFAALAAVLGLGCAGTHSRPMPRLPSGATAFLAIEHVNRMGSSFELTGLRVSVDGSEVFARDGTQPLPPQICVSRGRATFGTHDISVQATYRGHGAGVFSYLNAYQFRSRASTRVEIPADAYGLHVRSEGYEGGGATTPLEERPQLRFVGRAERDNPEGYCPPPPPPAGRSVPVA